MGVTPYITKLLGVGAAGFLIKDAVSAGVAEGKHEAQAEVGKYLTDVYVSHANSGDGYESTEEIKHGFRNYLMDSNIFSPFLEIKCAAEKVAEKLIVSSLPIGLATIAALTKVNKAPKYLKGFVPTIIGVTALGGLGLTAYNFFKEKVLPDKHI